MDRGDGLRCGTCGAELSPSRFDCHHCRTPTGRALKNPAKLLGRESPEAGPARGHALTFTGSTDLVLT